MLKSRNLDDQKFADIVEHAVKRIPQLCGQWNNYNPSDPGITFVELLAWYKEMQQYHMNYYTDDMRLKLLKLLGSVPEHNKEAESIIEVPEDGNAYRKGSRLITPEEVVFELKESIPSKRTVIDRFYASENGQYVDITQILQLTDSAIPVFSVGVQSASSFVITFREVEEEQLSLWFELKDPGYPKRNTPRQGQKPPRQLKWEMPGAGEIIPFVDETYALSRSGFIRFHVPKNWIKINIPEVENAVYCLKVSCIDPGCEEQVCVSTVSSARFKAVQHEVISDLRGEYKEKDGDGTFLYNDYYAQKGSFTVFVNTPNGWMQDAYTLVETEKGRGIRVERNDLIYDGRENVTVCISDPEKYYDLFLNSNGLPNQRIKIETNGKQILTDRFLLICDRPISGGKVRQELWNCVDSLNAYGPSDKVFTYDNDTQEICFGDGEHGCIVPAGEGSIFIARMIFTLGSAGNIPAGNRLQFQDNKIGVSNTEARGGKDAETTDEAAGKFLKRINNPDVCVSALDYENVALHTPGLRVLSAKAIPGYDPDEPTGIARGAVVTVIVVPAGSDEHPMPSKAFLNTVSEYLEEKRNICIRIKVRGPRYMPLTVKAELIAGVRLKDEDVKEWIDTKLQEAFMNGERKIGDPIRLTWIYSILKSMPGVAAVRQAAVRTVNSQGKITGIGDLDIPADAIPYINSVSITQR